MAKEKDVKYQNLFLGLLFDGVGMLSFIIPGIGDRHATYGATVLTRSEP